MPRKQLCEVLPWPGIIILGDLTDFLTSFFNHRRVFQSPQLILGPVARLLRG